MIGARALAAWALVALASAVNHAGAQSLALKRGVDATERVRCPAIPRATTPAAAARERARQLTTLAHEAAITGDNRAARDLFRQAAEADPSDAGLAYYLGRAHESLGESAAALREYCRYVALAPQGSDAADVRDRMTRVAPQARALAGPAASHFERGLESYEKRQFREAEAAFGRVVSTAPDWEPAFYNRGLANLALGRPERAAKDLERYLELAPDAPDRLVVARRLAELRRQAPSPGTALVAGLLPGVGQFYTRRPLLGLLVVGGVGGAAYVASQERTVTRTERFTDPFGNELEFEYTDRERPNFTIGVAVAAGLTLAGAVEAYLHARRSRAALAPPPAGSAPGRATSIAPLIAPGEYGATRLGLSVRFGGR